CRCVVAGMAVPVQLPPPRADRVQDAMALEIVKPHAFGAADRHQRQRLELLHLRARMPHRAAAAAGELRVRAHAVASISASIPSSSPISAAVAPGRNGTTPSKADSR